MLRIDLHGQPSPFARMVPLASGAVWVDEEDGLSKRFDGLPWFLDDMRPQGLWAAPLPPATPSFNWATTPATGATTTCCARWPCAVTICPATWWWARRRLHAFTPCPPAPAAWPRQTPTPHWQTLPCRAAKADLRRAASSPSSARLLAATLRRAMCW
ncbi:hypothetical protein [Candidatus Aalborgicola defluviihabitans]|uniref:hypothetical protein n=1 Tax=Candidatus Aalborgicola defluviihabitans TaxID=3386187 RepID=UPI0039B89121